MKLVGNPPSSSVQPPVTASRRPKDPAVAMQDEWQWRRHARCHDLPLDLFFPPDGTRGRQLTHLVNRAKQICQLCPVLEDCRDHAVNAVELHGVWGATTPADRERLHAQRETQGRAMRHRQLHPGAPLASGNSMDSGSS